MPRMPPSEAEADVLRANAAFYSAFSEGDVAAMNAVWAEESPLACFHPGAPGLFGRAEVLGSWQQILRPRPPFTMRCDRPRVQLLGETALILCYEANGDRPAHLAATNVFVLEGTRWRMVHHQAGPLSSPLPRPADPSTVN
jgi:ketosteroid isomerase-like protein